ncbi:MAG: nucleotidyltransferase family protein, partial [Clostridia bacterium]|nr:nucleotidyltransferase family protein [Clostridia bacterium]
MKISSIICEYNPFHAGHLYHLERTKQQTGCDFIIAIMSGSFVQRGLPAVYDKWARTDAALANGADLVLELPTAYSCASAERFAFGGVRLAELTGITDTLSFGCETEDIT